MVTIAVNPRQILQRVFGNLEAIGAELVDNTGTVIDLSCKTMLFRMVAITPYESSTLAAGDVAIDNASATIDSASQGYVSYTFSTSHARGKYACYFVDDSSTDKLYPYDPAKLVLEINDETGL